MKTIVKLPCCSLLKPKNRQKFIAYAFEQSCVEIKLVSSHGKTKIMVFYL